MNCTFEKNWKLVWDRGGATGGGWASSPPFLHIYLFMWIR